MGQIVTRRMKLFHHNEYAAAQDHVVMQEVLVNHTQETIRQRVHLHGRLSLAGKIRPHLMKLYIDPQKLEQIKDELMYAIDLVDVVLLIVLGLFSVPLGRIVYNIFERTPTLANSQHGAPLGSAISSSPMKKAPDDVPNASQHLHKKSTKPTKPSDGYHSSVTYSIAVMVQQMARLAAIVYWFDCALIVVQVMGFRFTELNDPSGAFTRCLFTTWGCFKLMSFKRYLLGEAINRKPDKLGKAVVCDRVVDVLIYMALGLAIMDTINFQVGPGLASLFAFGGLGTFVFGMASRDMAAQIVSGIAVTTSEKFHVGEDIQLGDSTRGIVENMGWLYTDLRGFDEIIIKIPNNQLASQRISNISRMDKCQVKVNLRVSYADHAKIPTFCASIKEELLKVCQELISDGSRPFRANWRGFESDHLLVIVDTHHFIKPSGDKFLENQELVFQTIARVATECGITFAMPRYDVRGIRDGHSHTQETVFHEGQLT